MAEVDGPLRHARFGGVLEGRLVDPVRLQEAAAHVDEAGVVRAHLEIDGGRWSLMFDDEPVPGERAGAGRIETLVDRLGELIEASGAPETAESTLHCTEVYDRAVRETLFLVRGGRLEPVSRVRPIAEDGTPADEDAHASGLKRIGRRRALIVGVLLLVGFSLMAWRSGYLDRLFSHAAEDLSLDTGPFGDLLALSVEKEWGNYVVTVRRGPGFPETPEDEERLRREAEDPARRLALDALRGGSVWVQLVGAESRVLSSVPCELRSLSLLGDADVEAELPGRLFARGIRLSLQRGTDE